MSNISVIAPNRVPAINNGTEEDVWENALLAVLYRKDMPNNALTAIHEADTVLNAFKARRGNR